MARTLFAIEEIEQRLTRYILSLYSSQDLSDPAFNRGNWHRSYYAPSFYGTQGVFYPFCVRRPLADYLSHPENVERKPGDLLISEWAHENNCLYATQGSLVDHMGEQSTGLGGYHTAWQFLE
jgi:hypothetical protein